MTCSPLLPPLDANITSYLESILQLIPCNVRIKGRPLTSPLSFLPFDLSASPTPNHLHLSTHLPLGRHWFLLAPPQAARPSTGALHLLDAVQRLARAAGTLCQAGTAARTRLRS